MIIWSVAFQPKSINLLMDLMKYLMKEIRNLNNRIAQNFLNSPWVFVYG